MDPRNADDTASRSDRRWLIRTWFGLVAVVGVALLYGHTFHSDRWNVDAVTLGLLGLLLLVPLADRITKLRLGDFEAEISPHAARRAIDDAQEEVENLTKRVRIQESVVQDPRDLFRQWANDYDDASKAMAADRIDLERSLRRVADLAGIDRARAGIGTLADRLAREGTIDVSALAAIRDVAPVLNTGAHGLEVDWQIAYGMHEVVTDLTSYLAAIEDELAESSQP